VTEVWGVSDRRKGGVRPKRIVKKISQNQKSKSPTTRKKEKKKKKKRKNEAVSIFFPGSAWFWRGKGKKKMGVGGVRFMFIGEEKEKSGLKEGNGKRGKAV